MGIGTWQPSPARTVTADSAPDRQRLPAPSLVEAAALRWVIQLRWIAAAVQGAILVVAAALELGLPFAPLIAIAGITAATNLAFVLGQIDRAPGVRQYLVIVQLIDVGLLTALLYFTGGPANPAVALYIVHVAIAATVLGSRWASVMVAISTLCYAGLLYEHLPLPPPSPMLEELGYDESTPATVGTWLAYVLVAVMMTYFIARVRGALRERDAELQQARSLMAKQERLAALTTLAAGAAHELSTPLATIAVAAAELERGGEQAAKSPEALREDARLIRDEVQRCREVLDRMSGRAGSLAGTEPIAFEEGAIRQRLAAALPSGEARRLHISLDEQSADDSQAAEASPAVGLESGLLAGLVPVVENALLAQPQGEIEVTLRREADRLLVEVRDSGPGIDAATLGRVGEPFFTTRVGGRGMGLGVFLARLIAERYGGRLEINSVPGEGTTVRFEIPQTEAGSGARPAGTTHL